jgi:hypothetical protein
MDRTKDAGAAENAVTRQCSKCQSVLPFTIELFPERDGQPYGVVCRTCNRNRRRDYELKYKRARIADRNKRKAAGNVAVTTSASVEPAATTGAVQALGQQSAEAQLTRTMRADVKAVNEAAPRLVATILDYASKPKHPLHDWALKFIAERVMPKKLYEDLGAQAAGSKAGRGAVRPAVTVIIQQTAPASPDPLPLERDITAESEVAEDVPIQERGT